MQVNLKLTAKRLIECRKRLGLSQQDVANRLDIGRPAYTYYENAKRLPTSENLLILSDMFNVSTDYLLGQTDDSTPPKAQKSPKHETLEAIINDAPTFIVNDAEGAEKFISNLPESIREDIRAIVREELDKRDKG